MEMTQAERPYSSINFKYEDIAKIVAISKLLEKELGVKYSNRATLMYALKMLEKQLKKG